MDPIAHTLTGAALAASGLRRATPLATAALLIAANAPDVDIAVAYAGEYMALAHRRGWTHGLLAILLLPLVLAGALMLWDQQVRRRLNPGAEPARWQPLLLVCAIGVLSHPTLDWLNNYGMRWLMPFDGRWFYGDALFIIDPWLWLVLGGLCFLVWSRRLPALLGWLLFWLPASWLVLTNPLVPALARVLWVAGLVAIAALRFARPALTGEKSARFAVAAMALYMTANVLANIPARMEVRAELEALGLGGAGDIMIGPVPANPFRATVVAATADHYYLGSWDWLASPRLELGSEPIERNMDDPVVKAAVDHVHARRFLSWSRFPYAVLKHVNGTYHVRLEDARYAGFSRKIEGPVVLVDGDFGLLTAE